MPQISNAVAKRYSRFLVPLFRGLHQPPAEPNPSARVDIANRVIWTRKIIAEEMVKKKFRKTKGFTCS